ncbi:carbohydrate ABC transporter permease [Bradyrhizobium elkanii]|uniref:carbohydrate ABC transporter permease n=1 Tax=Bradyrhizobium elkanii TaxID=29448 RepID=UPI00209CC097|nr:sugar ABC transporter permease [Bradyrhizobium elkanii]MCP1755657.1 multiple sugar transport system permease protein [Bradyrhizobium elkanii]MCP1981173.1 multiple sugar transport system permease protein [Bradyrhizobium elkanii]MCS3884049.1 multiple sugar transport system permease protein [Bradyrhizobium elkanii]MCS4216923.1 multiple sugar transport system permease protein [Bradyrhizobium elkanii]MCW2196636.1 multiple sugar transport system permease protein [Bradyrhizobium elkanii]
MTLQSSTSQLASPKDKAITSARYSRLDWWSIAAIAPAIIVLLGFFFLFLYGVFQSLTDLKFGRAVVHFIGIDNYASLIKTGEFWSSIHATLVYAGSGVLAEAVFGLAIAKLFATEVILARAMRPVILLPLVLPPMSVALMWTTMMDPQNGIMNYLLSLVGIGRFAWISDSKTAMFSLVLIDVWTYTPFFALIISAGLQGINEEIREAARVNGAKGWATFLHIELPLIAPYILIAAVFRLIESLNQFDIIFGTTQGGPGNSTSVLSVRAYIAAFQNLAFGRGAALMVVNWMIVLIGAFAMVRLWRFVRQRVS